MISEQSVSEAQVVLVPFLHVRNRLPQPLSSTYGKFKVLEPGIPAALQIPACPFCSCFVVESAYGSYEPMLQVTGGKRPAAETADC
eukprot:1140176-Pelagomonas_calceolata.AAC.6